MRRDQSFQQPPQEPRGFASIIVTLIMMLVISLLVVGFAAVSRREQRQSLDQQLSTQAFYAAESGVDDARAVITRDLANGLPAGKTNCTSNTDPRGTYPTGNATVLDAANQVSYSCLKVDVAPKDALYSGVSENFVVVPITTSAPIDSLNITWQPSSPPQGTPADCPTGTANVFSRQPDWNCRYGVLRTDLVATGTNLTRTGLQSSQMTSFFVPDRAGGTGLTDYGAGKGKPNVVSADCDRNAYTTCHATISNLGGGTHFTLRLSSIYRNSDISVTATQNGSPLSITGAQALIDSTGKAQDVIRRIQVRMPLTVGSSDSTPPYAIQTNGSICKRFKVTSTAFTIPGDIVDPDNANPMCLPVSSGSTPTSKACPNGGYDIVLTTDTTGSLSETWKQGPAINGLKTSLKYFVNNINIKPAGNHVSLIGFSQDENRIYNRMESSPTPLVNSINGLRPDNSTQYIIGLNMTYYEMTSEPKYRPQAPKVLLFVTDGRPDDPYGPITSKMRDIQNLGAIIYTIGIDGSSYTSKSVKPFDEGLLRAFTYNGGTYTKVRSEGALAAAMKSIASDLKCD